MKLDFPPVPKNKWSLILIILAYRIIPLISPSVTVKLRKIILTPVLTQQQ